LSIGVKKFRRIMSGLRKRVLSALTNSLEASYVLILESALQRFMKSSEEEKSLLGMKLVATCEQLIPDEAVRDFLVYLLRKKTSAGHLAVKHGIKRTYGNFKLEIDATIFESLIDDSELLQFGKEYVEKSTTSSLKMSKVSEYGETSSSKFEVKEVQSFGPNTKPDAFKAYISSINIEYAELCSQVSRLTEENEALKVVLDLKEAELNDTDEPR
jgi:hypothetical protein